MTSDVTKQPISLVKLAHSLIRTKVKSGDIVIDATVGNGHDTRFLLALIKPGGKVFGFDIQQAALNAVQNSLPEISTGCLSLIHASHAALCDHIPTPYHSKISAVMFNLGYLPGGNKQIITQTDSTLTALKAASQILVNGGIMTILAYPGHEGGKLETEAVKSWSLALNPEKFKVNLYETHPDNPSAPKLFVIEKTG